MFVDKLDRHTTHALIAILILLSQMYSKTCNMNIHAAYLFPSWNSTIYRVLVEQYEKQIVLWEIYICSHKTEQNMFM
jgi:hypothetical protein